MSTSDKLDFSVPEETKKEQSDRLPPFKIIDLSRKKRRAGT